MAYTNQTRLERAITASLLIQLTDDSETGSVDTDILDQMISTADGEIDGYVQAHYSVPLSPTPEMIEVIADDLTIYYLYRRRRSSFGMPEDIVHTYDNRIKQLEKINSGQLDMGLEPPPASSGKVVAQSDGPTAVFTGGPDGSLRDF